MPSLPIRPMFRIRPSGAVRLLGLAVLAALAAALIAAEVWARRQTSHPRLAAAFERGAYARILILDPPGGSPGPARVTSNRWGMRGGDPPAAWGAWDTWLALGSSTTLCPYQDDSLAWPSRLQARLRRENPHTWIGNAGMDGITAVSLEAILDRIVREARPKGVFILADGPQMARDLSDEGRARPNPYDQALARRLGRMGDRLPWRKRIGLWRLFDRGDRRFIPDRSGHRPWAPPPLASPEGPLPPLDSLLPSLPAYRGSIRRMGALAKSMGMRAVFLTQPIGFGLDSAWARREARTVTLYGKARHLSCATERRSRDAYNAALLEVCASDSLECLDLAARMSGEPRWFYDGSHFNDAGSERAADLIAAYLQGQSFQGHPSAFTQSKASAQP